MSDTLELVLKERKPDIANTTIRNYAANIRRVRRALGEDFSRERLREWLEELNKPAVALTILASLTALHGSRYGALMDKYNILREDVLDSQRMSRVQSENWTTVANIKKMLRRMYEDVRTFDLLRLKTNNVQKYRLLVAFISFSIHHEYHFRNDLPTFKVSRTVSEMDKRSNYFVMANSSFYLRNFKTSRAFARNGYKLPLVFKCSKVLAKLIRGYLRVKPESPWLISKLNGDPFTKNSFSNLLTGASKRRLDVRLGTTQLRHIYISEFIKTAPTIKQRRALALRMQQLSLLTQERYRKLPDIE